MGSVDQDIARNQALNNAFQINIGSLQLGREDGLQEFSSLVRSFLELKQAQPPTAKPDLSNTAGVGDFLEDLAGSQVRNGGANVASDVPERTLFDALTSPSGTDFWAQCFPKLQFFDHIVLESLHRYASRSRAAVLDSLTFQQQVSLGSWVKSLDLRILCIDGCIGTGASDWTTDLALETIGATQDTIASLEDSGFAILYHLCSPSVEEAIRTPEIVTQDLIMQLVTAFSEKFTQPLCRKHRITQARFERASHDLQPLWHLLKDCLIVANPKSLVIVLDNVDNLREEVKQAGTLDALHRFLDNVNDLTQHKSIFVKIMPTTRLPEVSDYLATKTGDREELSVLRIPTAPNVSHRTAQSRNIFRVPIKYERNSYSMSPDRISDEDEAGATQDNIIGIGRNRSFTALNTVRYEEHQGITFSDESEDEFQLSDMDDIMDEAPESLDAGGDLNKMTNHFTDAVTSPISVPYQYRNRSDISLLSAISGMDSLDREIMGDALDYGELDLEIMASG